VATIAREREALWDVVGTLVIAAILARILQTNLALTMLGPSSWAVWHTLSSVCEPP
jgi:hypothetical protein